MSDPNISQNSNPQPLNNNPSQSAAGTSGYTVVPLNSQYITFYYSGTGFFPNLFSEEKEEEKVESKNQPDGCSCRKCQDFKHMAEPNQEDGTFVCWSCRHGY